jgi:hypothetical protein
MLVISAKPLTTWRNKQCGLIVGGMALEKTGKLGSSLKLALAWREKKGE